jgi:endonuclease-3
MSQSPVPRDESLPGRKRRARRIARALRKAYPDAQTALHHRNPFELLIATILSAQCTDVKVNEVTPALFARFPDAQAFARADLAEIERMIHATGFFRQKAKSIQNCSRALIDRFAGQIPKAMEALVELPGVGRKTANVLRGNAMGLPGIVVDTHVKRNAERLGLTAQTDPVKIEFDLMKLLPEKDWTFFSNALIWHGRRICGARAPQCPACPLLKDCPHGQTQVQEFR